MPNLCDKRLKENVIGSPRFSVLVSPFFYPFQTSVCTQA